MTKPMELQFDEPHLAAAVERLPPEAVDTLPFGAIRLGPDGIVGFYSQAEGVLSGYGPRPRAVSDLSDSRGFPDAGPI